MEKALPAIPAKRYFTIGEVSDLCGVKPYVLRYWEQEFTQLKPMKRRGNRRYYQHHEVLLIRRIRELLYAEGFTISGARNRLSEGPAERNGSPAYTDEAHAPDFSEVETAAGDPRAAEDVDTASSNLPGIQSASSGPTELSMLQMRLELISIRGLLTV